MRKNKLAASKVDSRTRDAIASTLADILTISTQEAKDIIGTIEAQEGHDLQDAFSSGVMQYGVRARKWRAHTLSRLPTTHWKQHKGFFFVEPFEETSLKYLSATTLDEKEDRAQDQIENRMALHTVLIEILPSDLRTKFAAMLEWSKIDVYKDAYPLLEDVAFAHCIYALEHLFFREYSIAETALRKKKQIPETESTPYSWMPFLAEEALSKARAELVILDVLSADNSLALNHGSREKLAGELTVELLCNITANRALLEQARIGELAKEAAQINCFLLEALNRNDITEIPVLQDEKAIGEVISAWFGEDGQLSAEPRFSPPLKGDNMRVLMHQAAEVHEHYLFTRAREARHQHCRPENKFMFVLALIACFYNGTKVDKEFLGDTNPVYQVIPAQNIGKGVESRLHALAPHARELIKSMYGQLFYGNKGWKILAEDIASYEEGLALKRSCLQELIFGICKRVAPANLLAFHWKLEDIADEQKKFFHSLPPDVPRPQTKLEYMFVGIDELLGLRPSIRMGA
ncbi:hypothetical protein ABC383_17765 [Noviherbaspirillum sp. 1P10PC]|uniref:hypothetical protein n=1 Tax=Noviherbaspirillum sp. 1P10PC TaxID=3132292 RepID=UPI0039A0C119